MARIPNFFGMPIPSLAFLFTLVLGLTNALPWSGPEETGVYRGEEFSPRPTGIPDYPGQIFKRDSVAINVCGWVGGRPESVARCGSGSSCIHDTIHGFVGCCATAGPCMDGVYTTCIDSGMQGWNSIGGLINNGVLSCRASSTCYQNSFPGNYKQFTCGGASVVGGEIQTTYDGQPRDMRLQVVYTGISFSPMSRPPVATVPFTPEPTSPDAGKASNTIGAPAATATAIDKNDDTGYIAGGTVGGIAVAAILIAAIILVLRRRKRNGHRVGGFVGLHHRSAPANTSGPLKRLTKLYSSQEFGPIPRRTTAQDEAYMSEQHRNNSDTYLEPVNENGTTTYISPLTGHPDESHQQPQMREQNITIDRDLLMLNSPLSASTYNGTFPEEGYATAVPISRLNIHHHNSGPSSQSHSPQLLPSDEEVREQQHQPLVGIQIDDFGSTPQALQSRNWAQGYANLNSQNEEAGTHIHSGHMQESQDLGLLGNMRRAATQMVHGNSRTQDKNVRSESMRHSNPFSDEHATDDNIWKSTPMSAPKLKEPDGLGLGLGNWGNLIIGAGESGSSQQQLENKETSRPLMEQMMEAFNAATRGVSGNSSLPEQNSERVKEGAGSPTISSASAASRYGGMYAVPEEVSEEGEASSVSSVGNTAQRSATTGGLHRGQSSASMLRKPVGGSARGHRASRSDV